MRSLTSNIDFQVYIRNEDQYCIYQRVDTRIQYVEE